MVARIVGWTAAALTVVAMMVGVLGASPATAGLLAVNVNADANGSGCGVFRVALDNSGGRIPYNAPCSGRAMGITAWGTGAVAGDRVQFEADAPPGIAIIAANVDPLEITNVNNGQGWGGGAYWAAGGAGWYSGDTHENEGLFNSSYWGFQLICGWARCTNPGSMLLNTIQLIGPRTRVRPDSARRQQPLVSGGALGVERPRRRVADRAGRERPIRRLQHVGHVKRRQVAGSVGDAGHLAVAAVPRSDVDAAQGAAVDTRDYITGAGQLP